MELFKKKRRSSLTESEDYLRIATKEDPFSITAESYRRIKLGLEYTEVDKKIQVIQLCSAGQGEGKTTTALNMACTYVEDNKKVCIVDLDFRRPKLHRVFRIENKNGITDVLAGKLKLEEAIKKNEEYGFDIINRGTKAPYPTAILGSEELKAVFEQLRTMYDFIIVDCPPILAVSDAAIIGKLCDGCLFIIYQQETEKAVAKEAIKALKANNINVIGAVVTGISSKEEGYYGSKYKYYHSYYTENKK